MRGFLKALSALTLAAAVMAAPAEPVKAEDAAAKTSSAVDPAKTTGDDVPQNTIFNGKEVPPMKEVGANIDEEIKDGYWCDATC